MRRAKMVQQSQYIVLKITNKMERLFIDSNMSEVNAEFSTTAAIDNSNFKAGAFAGDMVVLVGRLTYVGKSSMEIRVDAYVEDDNGIRRSINRAYVVMVAIDSEGKAVPVPGITIDNESERAEWESGKKRYELRKQRRVEGFQNGTTQCYVKRSLTLYVDDEKSF